MSADGRVEGFKAHTSESFSTSAFFNDAYAKGHKALTESPAETVAMAAGAAALTVAVLYATRGRALGGAVREEALVASSREGAAIGGLPVKGLRIEDLPFPSGLRPDGSFIPRPQLNMVEAHPWLRDSAVRGHAEYKAYSIPAPEPIVVRPEWYGHQAKALDPLRFNAMATHASNPMNYFKP